MDDSWDPESESEYMTWIRSGNATEQQKKDCAKLWAIMKEGILRNGPVGLTQCKSVRRRDGQTVDLYCHVRRDIVMCFAIHASHVHLVVMGPYNDHTLWDTAIERTGKW